MSPAPPSCIAQDSVAIARWGAEACCSSKDTVSRMNSPRNSKSSGTPLISPEPKSQLCIGAEVEMEEEDISSQSGHARQMQTAVGGFSGDDLQNEQQLRHAVNHESPTGANSSDCATHSGHEPATSSSSHRKRDNEHELCGAEGGVAPQSPVIWCKSLHEAEVPTMDSAKSRQSIYGPMPSIDSSQAAAKSETIRARKKRQKLVREGERCLERLKLVEQEVCHLANQCPQQLSMPMPTEGPLSDDAQLDAAAEESLSRACSTPPATKTSSRGKASVGVSHTRQSDAQVSEGIELEDAPPIGQQKAGKSSRRAAGTGVATKRKSSSHAQTSEARMSTLEEDEDYLPPGEALEFGSSKKPRLRGRGAHQSSCRADVLPTAGFSSHQLQRQRGGACFGSGPQIVSSPSGHRRLRSQPVDLTDLRPDAFAYAPPSKRLKQCALHQGLNNLQQLSKNRCTPLIRSHRSGIVKPRPRLPMSQDHQLLDCTLSNLEQMKLRHGADSKLMDGSAHTSSPDPLGLSERLGQSSLGKAVMQGRSNFPEALTAPLHPDQLLPYCKQLFPPFMARALAVWDRKLESSCVTLFGEAASCVLARQQRDAQNSWDDLLARHALETSALGEFQDSLHCFGQWLSVGKS